MANILFAWELGANFGHLSRDLPVAVALRAAGHNILFAVRDSRVAKNLLIREGLSFIQAPLLVERDRSPPASYAEILQRNGYSNSPLLAALVDAWILIAQNYRADLVIANHAPTAVLAMRCLGVSVVGTCIGFELPHCSSIPVLFTNGDFCMERALEAQDNVIRTVNAVLGLKRKRTISKIIDIFSEADIVMTTLEELDHYGPRNYRYVGPVSMNIENSHDWSRAKKGRIFAYLRKSTPNADNILLALGAREEHSVCVMPDADLKKMVHLDNPHLTVQREPINIRTAMSEADVVITYGTGTLHDALLAGKPVLFCPQNNEQLMAGRRLFALGAGLMLPPGSSPNTIHDVIELLSPSGCYAAEAAKFRAKYNHISAETAVHSICESVDSALQNPKISN